MTITSPRATLRSTPSRTTLSPNALRIPTSSTRFWSLMCPSSRRKPTGRTGGACCALIVCWFDGPANCLRNGHTRRAARPDRGAADRADHRAPAQGRRPAAAGARARGVTMGVSRSSLREALRALAMLGVAEMRHGDGTYLTSLEPEALMRPVGLVLALSATAGSRSSSRRASWSSRAWRRWPRSASPTRPRPSCAAAPSRTPGRARGPRGVHVGRHRAARADRPRGVQRRARRGCWTRSRAWASRAGAGPGGWRRVREQSARDHREIAAAIAARDPRRRAPRCCGTWRTSNGR